MESTLNTPKPGTSYQGPKKKVPMYLIAAIITLSVVAILLAIKLYTDTRANKENLQFVESEKQKLEGELNELIVEYDSLKVGNDSLASQLSAEQDKIRQLLKNNESSTTKIRMYERELETLRNVMRSYIVQIDSLNMKNKELTEENVQVRGELERVSTEYEDVSKERDELSSTVKIAKKLTAKSVVAEGLNSSSKPKDRAKKVAKIRVCFTVLENSVADPGNKMIYLRIIRPDDVVLSSPEAGMFQLGSESLVYSAKRELEYDNKDIEGCIYWDATEELIEGTYLVYIYAEGYEIGSGSLTLK